MFNLKLNCVYLIVVFKTMVVYAYIPSEIIDIPNGYNPYSQYPVAARQSMQSYSQYPHFYASNPYAFQGFYPRYPIPTASLPNIRPNIGYPSSITSPRRSVQSNIPVEIIDIDGSSPNGDQLPIQWCNPDGYCIQPIGNNRPKYRLNKPIITVTQEKSSTYHTNVVTAKPLVSNSIIVGKPMQTTITRVISSDQNKQPSVEIKYSDPNQNEEKINKDDETTDVENEDDASENNTNDADNSSSKTESEEVPSVTSWWK